MRDRFVSYCSPIRGQSSDCAIACKRYFFTVHQGSKEQWPTLCRETGPFQIYRGASEIRTHVAAVLIVLVLNVPSSAAVDGVASSRPRAVESAPLQFILDQFADMPGLSAKFREEKRIALLREPLISQGSIYFAPPDRIARHVQTPVPSVVLFIGNRVSYDFKGERGDLDIDSHPMIRGISSILRLLLSGDAEGLERLFDVKAHTAPSGRWEIVLRPSQRLLRERIEMMSVSGTGTQLREFHIAERNGDETTMYFSSVDTTRQFSTREAEQFFRLPDS